MIGIFDSGVGGLTVAKELHRALPEYSTVYFGDTARFPYGSQSPEQLLRYAHEDVDLLVRHGAKLVIAACHSISSVTGETMRQESPVPFFDMVTPSVAAALASTKVGRIGVIGTKATAKSGVYERLITAARPGAKVIVHATPMLVPIVEERWWKHPESLRIIRRSLAPLKKARVDTLVLGCTHYPIIQSLIQRVMGPRVVIVNPAFEVVVHLKKFLAENLQVEKQLSKTGERTYLASSEPAHFQKTAEVWLGEKIKVSK